MCFNTICSVTNRILIICLHHLDCLMIVCIHQNTELSIFMDSYNWAIQSQGARKWGDGVGKIMCELSVVVWTWTLGGLEDYWILTWDHWVWWGQVWRECCRPQPCCHQERSHHCSEMSCKWSLELGQDNVKKRPLCLWLLSKLKMADL